MKKTTTVPMCLSMVIVALLLSMTIPECHAFSVVPSWRLRPSQPQLAATTTTTTTTTTARHMSSTTPHVGATAVTTITSPQEYHDFLNQDDRLCVIKFHAAWCKSCQKFGVKFQALAHASTASNTTTQDNDNDTTTTTTTTDSIRFAQIEFSANAQLCRSLGIKRLPSVHISKQSVGLIDGFPCGPKKFPILQEKLKRYVHMSQEELGMEKTLNEGELLVSGPAVASFLKPTIIAGGDNNTLSSGSTSTTTTATTTNLKP